MAYTNSVNFSLIDGIQKSYNVKKVSAADEATAKTSFEDTLADVSDSSDEQEFAVNDKDTYKPETYEASTVDRNKALKVVAAKEEAGRPGDYSEEEMAGFMKEVIADIMLLLQEKLGMTAEELKAAMGELGMTEVDLLDAGSLTKLVVDIEADGNVSELLTNEELHTVVTELTDALEEAVEEFGEEFEQLKENFTKVNESVQMTDAEQHTSTVTEGVQDARADNGSADADNGAFSENAALFNEVVNNIARNISETAGDSQTMTADIVSQVIEQIKLKVNEDVTSMELQLTPEALGKINLQVSAKDGVITAQITTETVIAKEAIESQLALLKENLNEQGVKVEAVEVTVAPHQFEARDEEQREKDGDQQKQASRRRFIDVADDEEQQDEIAAAIAREIMMSSGNRMDIRT